MGIGVTAPGEKLEVNGSIKIPVGTGSGTPPTSRIYTTRKVFNVLDYGAVGDGSTNDRDAFQNALNDAGAAGGGIVYVPTGKYKIDHTSTNPYNGHLVVPESVILEGVFQAPQLQPNNHQPGPFTISEMEGSVLLVYETLAQSTEPFIKLNGHNAGVKGLTIYYPNQAIGGTLDSPTLTVYPYCIKNGGGGPSGANYAYLSVRDVLLLNPYNGIEFDGANRHLISGVHGQPLNIGIHIDNCSDVGNIEHVSFWPAWSLSVYGNPFVNGDAEIDANMQMLRRYQLRNAQALIIDQSDWEVVEDFFAILYYKGIVLGNISGQYPTGQFSNIQIDQGDIGIDIPYSIGQFGIHMVNVNFQGSVLTSGGGHSLDAQNLIAIRSSIYNTTYNLHVSNVSFGGGFNKHVDWNNGVLFLDNCFFVESDVTQVAANIAGGTAIIKGCWFHPSFNNSSHKAICKSGANTKVILSGNYLDSSVHYIDNAYTIINSGNVGIGTTQPSTTLDVNGNGRFRSVGSGTYNAPLNLTADGTLTTSTSDRRKKKKIRKMNGVLANLSKLRGVNFQWKDSKAKGKQIGMIAQEVEKVFPELVFTNPTDGYKGIRYAEITAVLVEAIKEQQQRIEMLEKKLVVNKGKKPVNRKAKR